MGLVALAAFAALAAACGGGGSSDDLREQVVLNYADGVHELYSRSLTSARAMHQAIDRFLDDPTVPRLEAAKRAWLVARDDYGPTEAFRFYDGPIDNPDDGPEGLINAWPLDEAYIDYVEGNPAAGIVGMASEYPVIDAALLESLNEQGGEENVSTGWHAIEFLLWGQDLSDDGPGDRPVEDYTTNPNADRRATYLRVASDLLLTHLEGLVDAWAPGRAGNFRADFVAKDVDAALRDIITGIGELSRGELAGERMTVAYEERSQEDEHSCFSDNTVADIVGNARGIQMVYTGEYVAVSGPGIGDLIESEDSDLAARAPGADRQERSARQDDPGTLRSAPARRSVRLVAGTTLGAGDDRSARDADRHHRGGSPEDRHIHQRELTPHARRPLRPLP